MLSHVLKTSLDRNVGKWSVTTSEEDTARLAGIFDTKKEALYFIYLSCQLEEDENLDEQFVKMIKDSLLCGYGSYVKDELTYWLEEIREYDYFDESEVDVTFEKFSEMVQLIKRPKPKGKVARRNK